MNILAAIDDRNLLGASIRDAESWKPWRALLAAAFGLPLALYRACTGRTAPPGAPAAYLGLCIGRRSGKSFAMALTACYLAAFREWRPKLSPGERAIVLLVAADREQAKILHRYCQGILSPPIIAKDDRNRIGATHLSWGSNCGRICAKRNCRGCAT
jgi:hypothetical protein